MWHRAAQGSGTTGRAGVSDRRHPDDLGAHRHLRLRATSKRRKTVPGLAAHARDPAILHRFHRAILRAHAGHLEAGTPQNFRHQADEGGPGRRRSHERRDQDALCEAVQSLTLMVRGQIGLADNMTIAIEAEQAKSRFDWTAPVLWLFAIVLIALILLPLSWLAVYSLTDKTRHLTLQNFITLFSDPDFLDPLLTTAIIATTSAVICCVVAAPISWLVSRTDMPGRQIIRALVTASFVTPPFLGAVAWELLAAPNS